MAEDDIPPMPATLAEWVTLVAAFEAGSLPWSAWRHPQHLAVTSWYVRRDGVAATLAALPDRIRAFNAAHGVETTIDRGYHETLTRFWLALVTAYWHAAEEAGAAYDPLALLADLGARLGDKALPTSYWSPGRLGTWEARRGWVAPDLRAFPEGDHLPPLKPATTGL